MNKEFKILATTDLHGYLMPYSYADNKPANLGLARLKTSVNKIKDENTIVIDNGDNLQGSPFIFYHNLTDKANVNPFTRVINAFGYDYFNIGNHDFNLGKEKLKQHIKAIKATCISANVKLDGQYISKPYYIHTFPNGAKIALFGLVTDYITNWEPKENLVGVQVENAYESCVKIVKMIKAKEKVDAIVCAYHGGFEKDLKTGMPTETLTGENEGYRMCENIRDLDILITGHQHRSIYSYCCGKVVSQSPNNAKEMAYIAYDCINKAGVASKIAANEKPDRKLMELFSKQEAAVQNWLDQPLGHCSANLLIEDGFKARLNKHELVSFLNDVQFSKFPQADFSAVALFNDAKGFRNNITMRDIVATYVYSNNLVLMEVTGLQLKQFCEKCAEYFELENDEFVISPFFAAPKPAHFNYDMVDGLDYTIKVSNPVGHRIIKMEKNGSPIDLAKNYKLIVSNYRSTGGGNFDMLKKAKVLATDQSDMVEVIADYILANPEIKINHKDNIKVIK